MKKILGIYSAPRPHWVGDGFPVRSLFSYQSLGAHLSPFLMLDYAGPAQFAPAAKPRGMGIHPHRGFETVTIAYQGEVDHRDSTSAGGHIGPGDVQWMTAASGIPHEEFHSEAFTRQGGTLEMVQLWVNLPARDKLADAGYQTLLDRDIPSVALPGEAGARSRDRRRARGPSRPRAHLHAHRRVGPAAEPGRHGAAGRAARPNARAGGTARHGAGKRPRGGA